MIRPVILSGGSGTRLWPLSRTQYPKQFLPLTGEVSLLQQTLARSAAIPSASAPILVCNQEHRFLVAEQLRDTEIDAEAILLEPVGRNTAPAVTAAALQATRDGDDPLLLVLPSDHLLADQEAFCTAVDQAANAALQGYLMTFGIRPTSAETGYGYIAVGAPMATDNAFAVARFVEKPDRETACEYVDSGDYVWNSGMFLFRASVWLQELEQHAPRILEAVQESWSGADRDLDFVRLQQSPFERCPDDSVDYAVMERTDRAAVVPLDAGWNDIGSWGALWEVSAKDAEGNTLQGDVVAQDTRNCLVRSDTRLVATLGVENLIVVETADAVLVASRDRIQDIKSLVTSLKNEQRREAVEHRKVYRPWGSYDAVDYGHRFQVKRITVRPGGKLSLQMHHHRAEHWVVVKGTAKVVCGDRVKLLTEDQSTYIPVGEKHRLENPGQIPLELIEIQSGSYLGEDDIVRFEDVYGREQGQADG